MTNKGHNDIVSISCSFCGKHQPDVKHMIAGPNKIYICDECVDLCNEIIEQEKRELAMESRGDISKLMTPSQIKAELDKYIVGQEAAKQKLAVACYQHQLRIHSLDDGDVELSKSNVLLLGPTGTGKTEMARVLARILDVPFAVCDATSLTEAGYVGEDVENILLRLIQAADYDIERAERGIIYVDEIDKKAKKGENRSITRDVSGEGVQQALLKIVEGTIANVPPQGGRKHPHQETVQIDTKNILFIFAGAFEGITDIIADRLKVNARRVGFDNTLEHNQANDTELLDQVTHADLIKFGMIPELIGRLPVIAHTNPLTVDDLIRIQTEPVNSVVKQFTKIFRRMGVRFEVEEEAMRIIANHVIKRKTGARGLRGAYEDLLMDAQFRVPDMEGVECVRLTADLARNLERKLKQDGSALAEVEIIRRKKSA